MKLVLIGVLFWAWVQMPFFSVPFSVVWVLLALIAGPRAWKSGTDLMAGVTVLSIATMTTFSAGAMGWYAMEAMGL